MKMIKSVTEKDLSSVRFKNCSYLFYKGMRSENIDELCSIIDDSCEDFSYFYSGGVSAKLTTLPYFNTSNGINFSDFCSSSYITELPHYDTSKGEKFSNFICSTKIKELPLFNVGNGINFTNFLLSNSELTEIPSFDFKNAQNMSYAFGSCTKLTSIPLIDLGKCTNISGLVSNCKALTNLGGFKDLGKSYKTSSSASYSYYKLDLSSCTNLTHDSLMNVINNLYDIKTLGCKTQSLTLGSTNLAKLTEDEIAIATNKGWAVS